MKYKKHAKILFKKEIIHTYARTADISAGKMIMIMLHVSWYVAFMF